MSKGILSPFFPATQRDVSRLQQSATDAVNDLGSTATSHVNKVSGQLQDLAGHLQQEAGTNFKRARAKVIDLADFAREFATERPVVCIGIALALGFLIGLSRRRSVPANN